jgi:polar amino acid transport system substrate-binding protein
MHILKITGISALALGIGLTSASALTVEEVKEQGYIRAATANEVPYSYMQPDGTSAGIGPDVANAVLKSMGIEEVNWTVTPFGTLIPGLKARRFDFAAAEQNISPERCKQVAFTEPNSSYGEGLLVKKGNPKGLTTYADIAKDPSLTVAVVSGANNVDFLRAVGVRPTPTQFRQCRAAPTPMRQRS